MRRIEKIIFMGTPEFAVPTLKKHIQSNRKPQLVITQPDRKRGRGQKLSQSPIKKLALEYDLEVYQPQSVNISSSLEKIQTYKPDLIITAAFGKILKNNILSIPKYGCINLHPCSCQNIGDLLRSHGRSFMEMQSQAHLFTI